MTSIRCTLLTKKVVPSKAEQDNGRSDWRGNETGSLKNALLVSGVHDELVEAALRGKGQTERGEQRTTAITMHFDGGPASVLIDAEKSAESLAQAVGTWNLKR